MGLQASVYIRMFIHNTQHRIYIHTYIKHIFIYMT